jgi:hypothetical protein
VCFVFSCVNLLFVFSSSPCLSGCLLGSDNLYEGSHMLLQCVGVGMVLCGGGLGVFCIFFLMNVHKYKKRLKNTICTFGVESYGHYIEIILQK